MKLGSNEPPVPSTSETTHNVVEISNQLLPSSPPIPPPSTASPEPMDISEMTYELSITVYLNNERISTEFGMQKIGDDSLNVGAFSNCQTAPQIRRGREIVAEELLD
jgi:hypothetical protein